MKRALLPGAGLLLALTLHAAPARADWHVGFGIGIGGGYIQGGYYHHPQHVVVRPVHVHARVPVYAQVWVPPVHERIVVGHTRWGAPIVRTVLVRAGYHRQVVTGYSCSACGVACP